MPADERLHRIEELVKALKAEPASEKFVELAELMLEMGDHSQALKVCERGLGYRPDLAAGHMVYGMALVKAGDLQEGLRSFERAAALARGEAQLFRRVGQFLVAAGQQEAAQPYLQKAAGLGLAVDDLTELDLGKERAEDEDRLSTERIQVGRIMAEAEKDLSPAPEEEEDSDWEMISSPSQPQPGAEPWPAWDSHPPEPVDAFPAVVAEETAQEEDEEEEPPTVYQPNLLLGEAAAAPAAQPPADALNGVGADSLAEPEKVVDRAAQKRVTVPVAPAPEPAPWAKEDPSTRAVVEPPTMFEGSSKSAPAPEPPPTVYSTSPAGALAPLQQTAVEAPEGINYMKVFLLLLPFLLGGLGLGGLFAWRQLQAGKVSALLEQARASVRLDSFLGYGEARMTLEKVLEMDAESHEGRILLALVNARIHDEYGPNLELQQKATRLLDEAGAGAEGTAEVLWSKYHLGLQDGLAEAVENARARGPKTAELLELLARLSYDAGKKEEAAQLLEEAGALDPANVRLLYRQAALDSELGKTRSAREKLERAIAINGMHVQALLLLSELRLNEQVELAEARRDLERITTGIPQVTSRRKARAHALLARICFKQFERQRAVAEIKSAAGLMEDDASFLLELAGLCLEANELDEASELARAAEKIAPDDVRADIVLAEVELKHHRPQKALEKLNALAGKRVPAAPFLLLRGKALAKAGRTAEAIRDLEAIPPGSAQVAEAAASVAWAYFEAGDEKEAQKALKKALSLHGDSATLQLLRGEMWLKRGLVNGARSAFEKAATLDPRCYQANWHLALLTEERQPDQALVYARAALRANPFHVPSGLLIGRLLLRKGEADAAVKTYAEILNQDASLAEAYVGLAEGLLQLGDVEKALAASKKALEKGDKSGWAMHVRGRVLLAKGAFFEAVRFLSQANELKPKDAEVLADLGLALLGTRSLSRAEKEFTASLRLRGTVRAQEGLARLMKLKGRWADAARGFEKAAVLASKQKLPAEEIRRLYLESGNAWINDRGAGRFGQARRQFRKASELREKDTEALYLLATCWDREDKLSAARSAYLKVLEIDPAYPMALYRLGVLEYDEGHEKEARDFLQRFVETDYQGRELHEAKKLLGKLQKAK